MYYPEEIELLRKYYKDTDPRTWPYYPIVMPLTKDGRGPASEGEIDHLTWEVWDRGCVCYGFFQYLPDAIEKAMTMNKELFDE